KYIIEQPPNHRQPYQRIKERFKPVKVGKNKRCQRQHLPDISIVEILLRLSFRQERVHDDAAYRVRKAFQDKYLEDKNGRLPFFSERDDDQFLATKEKTTREKYGNAGNDVDDLEVNLFDPFLVV